MIVRMIVVECQRARVVPSVVLDLGHGDSTVAAIAAAAIDVIRIVQNARDGHRKGVRGRLGQFLLDRTKAEKDVEQCRMSDVEQGKPPGDHSLSDRLEGHHGGFFCFDRADRETRHGPTFGEVPPRKENGATGRRGSCGARCRLGSRSLGCRSVFGSNHGAIVALGQGNVVGRRRRNGSSSGGLVGEVRRNTSSFYLSSRKPSQCSIVTRLRWR